MTFISNINYCAPPQGTEHLLDALSEACEKFSTPKYSQTLAQHNRRSPRPLPDDTTLMKHLGVAIAHSQGSRSVDIAKLVKTKTFSLAFCCFSIPELAKKHPEEIIREHWKKLGRMRFRGKIRAIVKCADVLQSIKNDYGSFAKLLRHHKIPRRINTNTEFELFWEGFETLKKEMNSRQMPFFRSTTSLLQLLLDLDYDSVKPDLIIMRLARRLSLTDKETGDKNMKNVVQLIQQYCLKRPSRPSAVDLMMLSYGGQTSASELLSEKFCPPNDPCKNSLCSLGKEGLCSSYVGSR